MLQHGCFLFLLRAPADGGFDNTHTHIHIKMVDRIWQSLAMCKLNTASYPQNPSAVAMMSFQVAVALWDSVVHYQTISQDQQLILVATWSCPTWVLHPSPFSDIFWAWCTCHVSCWWSRVAHRPSKFVKVVSSPSLGFVFNHQPLLQHGCLLFLLRASADSGFDTWWVTFEMAWASLCPRARVPEFGTYLEACDPFSNENRGVHMAACTKLQVSREGCAASFAKCSFTSGNRVQISQQQTYVNLVFAVWTHFQKGDVLHNREKSAHTHLDSLWPCDVAGKSYFQQEQSSLMSIPNLSKCSFSTGPEKQDLKASILSKNVFLLHVVPAHLHLSASIDAQGCNPVWLHDTSQARQLPVGGKQNKTAKHRKPTRNI